MSVCARARRVENEDREPDKRLLQALESLAPAALQLSPAAEQELRRKNATWQPSTVCNWGQSVDEELVLNLYRYRRYDYTTVRDLLRVVSVHAGLYCVVASHPMFSTLRHVSYNWSV